MPLRRYITVIMALCLALTLCGGCTSTVRIGNGERGMPTAYEDPGSPGRVQGVGLESQDIVSMTDSMVRDILSKPELINRKEPARIVIDAEYFLNLSSNMIKKEMLTDRLSAELNRAARGRLVFLARHHKDMVEAERQAEREGAVTQGTQGPTKELYGWDYRLGGQITTLDMIDARSGMASRESQIKFDLVERGSAVIVWSNLYTVKKTAMDDITYR